MPLTSMTKCYKTLPSYFAEKVTQQMRKRHDTSFQEEADAEVKAVCESRSAILPSRDRPPSRACVLMTKRSLTPLAVVSDNESEDGSTPRAEVPGENCRSASGAGCKRESPSPRPSAAAYFLDYFRPRRTPTSPRTAISLDNVDLWEDDDSDSDDRRPSPGFDQINGVPINPRMTIDLSELRRSQSPVATKRNKLDEVGEKSDKIKTDPPTTLADLKAEMAAAKTRLLESRNKPRVRANRKLQNTTLHPESTGIGKPANYIARIESSEIKDLRSPIDKQKTKNFQFMPRLSGTYTVTDLKDGMLVPTPPTTTSNVAKANELSRINNKISALRSVNSNAKVNRNQQNLTINAKKVAAIKDEVRVVKDMDARGSSDSNMSTGSSASSPDRKVKFNNFVTVREGEMNTLDYLRESNNSAQMFKQKYLQTGSSKSVRPADNTSSGNIAQGSLRIELLC